MKTKAYMICIALFLVSASFAESKKSTVYPPSFFKTKVELLASVKNAFAGGSCEEIKCGDFEFSIVYRYASGALGCDASIYTKVEQGWRLYAYLNMNPNDSIKASCLNGNLVLAEYQSGKKLLIIPVEENNKQIVQPGNREVRKKAGNSE